MSSNFQFQHSFELESWKERMNEWTNEKSVWSFLRGGLEVVSCLPNKDIAMIHLTTPVLLLGLFTFLTQHMIRRQNIRMISSEELGAWSRSFTAIAEKLQRIYRTPFI